MLEDVHHKAYIRKNHERLQQEYCFVVTDGKGIIAIDTNWLQCTDSKKVDLYRAKSRWYMRW